MVHQTDLMDMPLHIDPWGSSNYRGTYIQGNVAGFVGTMDSTAVVVIAAAVVVVAEWLQSQSLLAETDQPLLWLSG